MNITPQTIQHQFEYQLTWYPSLADDIINRIARGVKWKEDRIGRTEAKRLAHYVVKFTTQMGREKQMMKSVLISDLETALMSYAGTHTFGDKQGVFPVLEPI